MEQGLFSRESSRKEVTLTSSEESKFFISIRLLDKYNFYSLDKFLIPSTATIRLFFKLSSVKLIKLSIFSILTIWLWDKFKILSELSNPNPSIFPILLLCKSTTSSLTSSFIFFIFDIEFFGNRRTFRVGTPFDKFSIYFI